MQPSDNGDSYRKSDVDMSQNDWTLTIVSQLSFLLENFLTIFLEIQNWKQKLRISKIHFSNLIEISTCLSALQSLQVSSWYYLLSRALEI